MPTLENIRHCFGNLIEIAGKIRCRIGKRNFNEWWGRAYFVHKYCAGLGIKR
jgi:hypothetical protein